MKSKKLNEPRRVDELVQYIKMNYPHLYQSLGRFYVRRYIRQII